MVDAAERELILVGYELTDNSLILSLATAASRGVEVVMICDRSRGAAARVLATWPSNSGASVLLYSLLHIFSVDSTL